MAIVPPLWVTLIATSLAILLFAWYTLLTDPQTFVILLMTMILAWVIEAIWRWVAKRRMRTTST